MNKALSVLLLSISIMLTSMANAEATEWWVYSFDEGRVHTYVDDTTVSVGKNHYSAVIKYVDGWGKVYIPKYYFWKDYERGIWMVSDTKLYASDGSPVKDYPAISAALSFILDNYPTSK